MSDLIIAVKSLNKGAEVSFPSLAGPRLVQAPILSRHPRWVCKVYIKAPPRPAHAHFANREDSSSLAVSSSTCSELPRMGRNQGLISEVIVVFRAF